MIAGIELGGESNLTVNAGGSIATTSNGGFGAFGASPAITASGGKTNITINGLVNTTGVNAPGIRPGSRNSFGVTLFPSTVTIGATGLVQTSGASSYGIGLTGNSNLIVSGRVAATGALASAILGLPFADGLLSIEITSSGVVSASQAAAISADGLDVALTIAGSVSGASADTDAITLGNGNDRVTQVSSAAILGSISGGSGLDTVRLSGSSGTIARYNGFEQLFVDSGYWTAANLVSIDATTIAAGSTLEVRDVGGAPTLATGVVTNQGLLVFNFTGPTAAATVFNSTISGIGSVTKNGSGNLVLGAANDFMGGLSIATGTVTVNTNSSGGSGGITINGGATLAAGADGLVVANTIATTGVGTVDSGTGTLTLGGVVGGAGSIVKTGTGNLVLANANSFLGGLNIAGGTATLGTSTAGSGTITISGGATLAAGADGLFLTNLVATTGVGTINTGAGTIQLRGVVSGAGSINKIGAGSLLLVNANTFAGGLNIAAGSAVLGTSTSAGTGTITIGGGATLGALIAPFDALRVANAVATSGVGKVNAGLGSLVLVGVVSGAGSISQIGTGNLVLDGANTFAGGLTIAAGTATLGTDSAAGTGTIAIGNGTTLAAGVSGLVVANAVTTAGLGTVNSGPGTFTLNGNIGGAGSINQIGTGNLRLNGANTFVNLGINQGTVTLGTNTAAGVGNITISDGAILASSGVFALVLANNVVTTGSGRIDSSATTFTLNGNVSGAGSISQIGIGTLVLNGANSFSGLGINSGTVRLGQNTSAGVGGITLANNTTLQAVVSGLVVANNIITAATGFISQGSGVFTLNGSIGGAGSITTLGVGNLVLNGANTFANLNINVGTVTVGTSTAAGAGGIAMAGGTTLAAGANNLVLANTITTAGGTINQGAGGTMFTLNGAIGGAGSITTTGTGNLVLGGANSFSGLNITNNGTVTVGTSTAGGAAQIALAGGTTLAAGANNLVLANTITTVGLGTINQGAGGNVLTLNGAIIGPGSITTTGAGNLRLNGANNFTGLNITNAGTVTLGQNTSGGSSFIALANGTTLAAGIPNMFLRNDISTAGVGTILGGTGQLMLLGTISGAGSITSSGSGNLVLTQLNSFNGLNIANGTVSVSQNTSAGLAGIAMADGTTLAAFDSEPTLANAITTAGVGTINQGTGGNVFTLNGAIGGLGSISTTGAGSLRLGGANSFIGLNVTNGGTVILNQNTSGGAGNIALANATILAAGGPNLVIANTITTAGAGTIRNNNTSLQLNGAISGPGSISSVGNGVLRLSGNNSFTNLVIANGTVVAANNTAAGIGNITIIGGTTLASGAAGITLGNAVVTTGAGNVNAGIGGGLFTLGGPISGPGSIVALGTGNLVLNGANTFTNLLINGGTVTFGTNTSGGIGGITIGGGTTLAAGVTGLTVANAITTTGAGRIDSSAGVLTLTNSIGGAGSIAQVGTGNLKLNAANSFANLSIASGTVTVGTNTSAGIGDITIAGGATLAAGVSGLTLANSVVTTGAATVDSGAGVLTLAGSITGAGGIAKTGSDTLVLTGASSYTGATLINAGTLNIAGSLGNTATTIASGATLMGNGSIAGPVTIANGGILSTGAPIGTLTLGALTLNDSSVVNFALGQPNVVGGPFNDLTVVTGNLTLDGLLNVTDSNMFGPGIYELFSYGGALTDNGLVIASLPGTASGNVQTLVPGQVNLVVAGPSVLMQFWDGADGTGNSAISGGSGTWNALNTNWTNAPPSQRNANWQGGIAVFQAPSGTVTINETQSFVGLQFATTGYVLNGGTGGLATDAGGSFAFTASDTTATINASISGTSSLAKQGSGTLILNGANSYAGGTDIQLGTLVVGSNTALGTGSATLRDGTTLIAGSSGLTLANAIATTGNGRVDSGAGVFTLAGPVTGAGSISQIGSGNLVLNGANSFVNLGINQGRVTLGTNTAAGSGSITIADGGVLAAGISGLTVANAIATTGAGRIDSGAGVFTLNGTIGGAGSISQIGTGNLVLNGANSFVNLGIDQGTVTVGSNTAAGSGGIAIGNGATLVAGVMGLTLANAIQTPGAGRIDSGAGTFTLGGAISGAGGVTKIGAGNLVLNGTSSFTGGTTVGTGRLTVGGTILGPVTLASGTTLAGTGTVGAFTANSGSTVSPGAIDGAVGTLMVNGNATFAAGSTFAVNVVGTTADRVAVTGAASLGGASISLTAMGTPLVFNTTYTLVTATGGRTGTFAATNFTQLGQAFVPTLVYNANDVLLRLDPASIAALQGSGGTANTNAVAGALDAAVAGGFNPQNFFGLFLQSGAALTASLNQFTGEIGTANSRTALADTRYVREAAFDRLGAALHSGDAATTKTVGDRSTTLWGRAIGAWTDVDAVGNGAALDSEARGVVAGIDFSFGDVKVGGLVNYIRSDVDTPLLGEGKVESSGGGIYAGYRSAGGFGIGGGGAISSVKTDSTRSIATAGIAQTLTGGSNGTVYQVFGEVSFDLAADAKARIEPFARLAYVNYDLDGSSEAGGFAALTQRAAKYDITVATAGIRGSTPIGKSASLHGSVGYQSISGDRGPVASVAFQGTSSFANIRGVALDKSSFVGEAGVDFGIGSKASLGVGYSGVIGKNNTDHGVKATFTLGF